jgi:Putative glutamine amidotransferase
MTAKVLYLGDTSLGSAAGYLAGVMTHDAIAFDYHASGEKFSEAWLSPECKAVILSDYPSANFDESQIQRLIERVQNGMGLLMIGGWESFTGLGGDYGRTRFQEVLPVVMQEADDRMNNSWPCVVVRDIDHPIVAGLPFDEDAPVVGGFNRVRAKAHAVTVLSVHTFTATVSDESVHFNPAETFPLLVLGRFGRGQVAAFASDVAPHWVGGLVDWGKDRVGAQAPGAGAVEVGGHYARLFANIIRWVSVGPGGGLDAP